MPESLTAGQLIAQLQDKVLKAFRPQTTFQKCGQSGMGISDFFPHIQTLADDICVIRSMVTTPCQTELIEAINQLNQDHAIENPVHVRDLHATMLLQSLSRPRQGL